jgi:multidrug transporter EmrE-like cation transporter
MIGFLWFKESMNALKIVSLALIILGVMGLELGNKIH